MALEPESVLGTPANYASPQQLAMARELAAALMKPQQGQMMQSWTQPASQIVNALLGARMMQQTGAADRSNAAGMLGTGSPLAQPGPGPQPAGGGDWMSTVKGFEGFQPDAKWDYKQYTDGYGTKAASPGEHIDPATADQRFEAEFGQAKALVTQRFPRLAPQQADALASFTFNLGPGWMQGSHLSQAIDAGDYNSAAEIMQQYNHAGGKELPGLTQRRQVEAKMLLSGPAPVQVADAAGNTAPGAGPAGPPQSSAGAQTQAAASPPGQAPQATPATPGAPQMPSGSAMPQTSPGGQPPPQLFRQPLITREQVYSALISQSPMAPKLMEMYLAQQQPQEMKYGDSTYRYIPSHPEIPPTLIPQPHTLQKMGGEGVPPYMQQFQQTPQGFVGSSVPSAGAPQAPPAGPSGSAPSVGTGAQPPSDFGSATQAAIDLKQREGEAQTAGQERGKLFGSHLRGQTGNAQIAAQQKQNLSTVINIANDPDMVSGPGADPARFFQRVATQLGGLAGYSPEQAAAAPREVFEMVMKRILADQFAGIRSMSAETGEQGGRIFRSMLDIEQAALPSANDSLPGIRAKLAILDRAGDLQIKWGKMAYDYAASHGGRLDEQFGKQMLDEMAQARLIPEGGRVRDLAGPTSAGEQGRAGSFARPMSGPQGWSIKRIDQ